MRQRRDRWHIETIDLSPDVKPEKVDKGFVAFFKKHWKIMLTIFVALYLVFFLFGMFTTRFYTDENGNKHAYRVSLETLKYEDDYGALKEKLDEVRGLLVDITIIDIHLANGDYNNYEASTMYTELLNERLDVMLPKVKSMNLQSRQEPIREEIISILSYDLALYLQNISKGLSSGSAESVSAAMAYRDRAFQTYEVINSDIALLAGELKIKDEKYFSWKLADEVIKADNSAVLKQKEMPNE